MADFEVTARNVLQKLAGGARLKRYDAAWLVFGDRGRSRPLTQPFVRRMKKRGWLRDEQGSLVITEAGRSWLIESVADPRRVLETRLIKDDAGNERYVVVNAAESPIALLHRRGIVNAVQFEAGEKLRRDFTIAQIGQRVTFDYSAPAGRGARRSDVAESAIAARQCFNRAMRAVGPGLSDLLFDVCCYLKGLETSEEDHQWPRHTARVVLCVALDRLAAHYRMRPVRRGRLRSWQSGET